MNFKGILLSDSGQSIKNTVKFLLYDIMKKRNSRDSVKKKERKKKALVSRGLRDMVMDRIGEELGGESVGRSEGWGYITVKLFCMTL